MVVENERMNLYAAVPKYQKLMLKLIREIGDNLAFDSVVR
jgi:hypothetical protein